MRVLSPDRMIATIVLTGLVRVVLIRMKPWINAPTTTTITGTTTACFFRSTGHRAMWAAGRKGMGAWLMVIESRPGRGRVRSRVSCANLTEPGYELGLAPG